MRQLLLFILLLSSFPAIGQKLTFRDHQVDTLRIRGFSGGYDIENDLSRGSSDILEIYFDPSHGHYIACYTETNYKHYSDTLNEKNNEDKVMFRKVYNMDTSLLRSFLTELDTKRVKAVFADLDITMREFHKGVGRHSVHKQIRTMNKRSRFGHRYSEKRLKDVLDGVANIDTFGQYLLENFQPKAGFSFTSDVSYGLGIQVKHSGGQFYFDGQFPKLCFQPLIEIPNTKDLSWECTLNLRINSLLVKMLPSSFCVIDAIAPEAVYWDYIKWHLNRKI